MVAYSFKRQFAEPIEAGTKIHTIRADRKRHARPGEKLQLYFGMRTKHCRLIREDVCSAVLPIIVNVAYADTGYVLVAEGYPFTSHAQPACATRLVGLGKLDGVRFVAAHREELARHDGFASWRDMRDFWRETHGLRDADECFFGKLIGWWR